MFYNDTISLFDTTETEEGVAILQYVLSGVYLEHSFGSKLVMDGEVKNYNATLFIPKNFISDDMYVKPKEWEKLSLVDRMHNFTIRSGQIVAMLSEKVSAPSLDAIVNEFDNVYRVIGVDYLGKVLPHFEVLCK